jgi:hypothetical protein
MVFDAVRQFSVGLAGVVKYKLVAMAEQPEQTPGAVEVYPVFLLPAAHTI